MERAVDAAALSLLDENGHAVLSLDEVARCEDTTRPAIYRRWPGKAHLALAAIASRLASPVSPDTGCTLCDLDESLRCSLLRIGRSGRTCPERC